MGSSNKRRHYNVKYLIGWAHTKSDSYICVCIEICIHIYIYIYIYMYACFHYNKNRTKLKYMLWNKTQSSFRIITKCIKCVSNCTRFIAIKYIYRLLLYLTMYSNLSQLWYVTSMTPKWIKFFLLLDSYVSGSHLPTITVIERGLEGLICE